jgi:hypothetical protein
LPGARPPPPGVAGLGTSEEKLRWPGGRVPYVIDPALPQPERVRNAIAHWEQHSQIRFRPAHGG